MKFSVRVAVLCTRGDRLLTNTESGIDFHTDSVCFANNPELHRIAGSTSGTRVAPSRVRSDQARVSTRHEMRARTLTTKALHRFSSVSTAFCAFPFPAHRTTRHPASPAFSFFDR
ncbi:hypothetical protein ACFQDE_02970 [Deinococcus caeni]|uniref:hypothetical protein n=1 Tax=Deinococcus caeni TaxID=569127 RepID=UPI0031EF43B8